MTIRIDDPTTALVLQDEIRRNDDARYDHRLHAILLATKNLSCPSIADLLGDSERTVRNWITAYRKRGLQGLVDEEKSGRPRKLTEVHLSKIDAALRLAPQDLGLAPGIWDGKTLGAFIKKSFNINLGVRQCQRIFRQLGFRLRKPRPVIARSDPEVQLAFKKKHADS